MRSLSVFDGWWLEERIEDVTGWGIGQRERGGERSDAEDAADLYRALEETILPIYHGQPKSLDRDHGRHDRLQCIILQLAADARRILTLAYQEQHPAKDLLNRKRDCVSDEKPFARGHRSSSSQYLFWRPPHDLFVLKRGQFELSGDFAAGNLARPTAGLSC
jgi:hypothetical protein